MINRQRSLYQPPSRSHLSCSSGCGMKAEKPPVSPLGTKPSQRATFCLMDIWHSAYSSAKLQSCQSSPSSPRWLMARMKGNGWKGRRATTTLL